jgi:aryl-alcohol dehydrogenase-like predicted oxidoreductase
MTVTTRNPLGRSGLLVAPLTLGTMTFGRSDFGCDEPTAYRIIDEYVEAGGNLFDTADTYGGGASEQIIGGYVASRRIRDSVVFTTKFTMDSAPREPLSGGNGRRSMLRALEGSLRRLQTDYVDLYLLHSWDGATAIEEVIRSFDDAVTAGKVRYVGLSNVPAWYAARAYTLAEWRGYERPCVLQLEYSLVERGLEYEFPSMCSELSMSLMPWSPLANGVLTGRYSPERGPGESGRLANEAFTNHPEKWPEKRTPRTWEIVAELSSVASEVGRSMAQVAINWLAGRPGVSTIVLGASKPGQIESLMTALDFQLSADQLRRLDEVSRPATAEPYDYWPRIRKRMKMNDWQSPVPAGENSSADGSLEGRQQ